MHPGAECIGNDDSVASAAQKMRDLRVGSLPICGADDRLHGIITDRDVAVPCIAEGRDPARFGSVTWPSARCSGSTPRPASARCYARWRTTR